MQLFTGLLIPFVGTALGSAMVFFMKRGMNKGVEKLLLGFASGVMIAASVWSLLIPAIDMAGEQGRIAWLPAAGGFLGGMAFLLVLDSLIPHLQQNPVSVPLCRHPYMPFWFPILKCVFHQILHQTGQQIRIRPYRCILFHFQCQTVPVICLFFAQIPKKFSQIHRLLMD